MRISHIYTCVFLLVSITQFHLSKKLMAQHIDNQSRSISVNGEGTAQAIPDMATVRFGIVVRDKNAEEARRINALTAKEAMSSIRELGVEESKLSLQTLRLQPIREYDPQTRKQVEKGYEAVRELVVVVEDLNQLPTLVSQIVQKGANRLNGITYGLRNQEEFKDSALVQAVVRARRKAELMASTLGVNVGKVIQVQELGQNLPLPVMRTDAGPQLMMAKSEAAPEPEAYAAGEIVVKATVRITFEVE